MLSSRGKGMRRVEPDRRQHRHDLAQEMLAHPGALGLGPVLAAQEADALRGEFGQHDIVQHVVLMVDQFMRGDGKLLQERARGVAADLRRVRPLLELGMQAGDPDLEELVDQARHDAQEAQPFEQRDRVVLGLREHAARRLRAVPARG